MQAEGGKGNLGAERKKASSKREGRVAILCEREKGTVRGRE